MKITELLKIAAFSCIGLFLIANALLIPVELVLIPSLIEEGSYASAFGLSVLAGVSSGLVFWAFYDRRKAVVG